MKISIMQPYFLPYIGYFQLMSVSDVFVVYDNIEYSKKGWINRNRFLINGHEQIITLPIKKASDYLQINERELADNKQKDLDRIIRLIASSYAKAPYFKEVIPLVIQILKCEHNNLFDFILNSIILIRNHLDISSKLVISSTIEKTGTKYKGEERVISICKSLSANVYINPPGGKLLYSKENFIKNGIELKFLNPNIFEYKQFNNNFIGSLSILDVLMFNSTQKIQQHLLTSYE